MTVWAAHFLSTFAGRGPRSTAQLRSLTPKLRLPRQRKEATKPQQPCAPRQPAAAPRPPKRRLAARSRKLCAEDLAKTTELPQIHGNSAPRSAFRPQSCPTFAATLRFGPSLKRRVATSPRHPCARCRPAQFRSLTPKLRQREHIRRHLGDTWHHHDYPCPRDRRVRQGTLSPGFIRKA